MNVAADSILSPRVFLFGNMMTDLAGRYTSACKLRVALRAGGRGVMLRGPARILPQPLPITISRVFLKT